LRDINISFLNSTLEPASTDSLGVFEITLTEKNQEISLSYPGFHSQTLLIDGKQPELLIWMTPEDRSSVFNEIQIPGRMIKQRDLTGAVVQIRNLDLDKTAYPSFDQILQGKIAGLQVINRSGMPGEGAYLHIRGYNSLFSSSLPLVVVDGMIIRTEGFKNSIINGFHNNPLSDINLNNISSVTILKDAVETALYGIKGSNGVIIINTDQPATGKTTLDVNISGGVASFNQQIPLMNRDLYKSYLMEQMYDAGMSSDQIFSKYPFLEDNPEYLYFEKYNNNTNWQNQIFRTGIISDANLKVKGGDERAMYSISGGFLNHNGIINNTNNTRFNFQFNSLVNVSARVNIGINLRFVSSRFNLMESGSLYQTNPIYASLIKAPYLTVFQQDQEGVNLPVTDDKDEFGFSNPYVLVHKISATNNSISFIGHAYLYYKINEKLSFKITFGLNRDKTNERLFIPSWGVAPQGNGSALRSMKSKVDQNISTLNEDYLSYNNTFNHIHHLTIDVGARVSIDHISQEYGLAQNSATDEFRNLNTGKSDEISFGGFDSRSSWLSYFAAIRYKLKDKYLASFFLSVDGSSRFGPDVTEGIQLFNHPFAVLPALGVAWRISNEPFLNNINWLNELKIRASYGLSGSDDYPDYTGTSYYVPVSYNSVTGFCLGGIPNPRIKWEMVRKVDIGLDASLFREKLQLSIDLYQNHTADMVTHLDLPSYFGYSQFIQNSGECLNYGIDMDIYSRIINRSFKWEIDFSYSKYKNEVVKLGQENIVTQFTGGEKITAEGMPFGMFYGYKSLGVFKTQVEAEAADLVDKAGRRFNGGDIHFADIDDNHIINEMDKIIIGDPHPDFIGGVYNKISYKSFSLSAQISFVYGNNVFNYMRSKIEDMSGFQNQSAAVYNRWVKNGQETSVPKSKYGDPMGNARFSNRWLEDGSFMRLNNLTFSYTYPGKLLFIRDMTIYFSGNNLLTWSKYLGYDPEFSYIDSALGQGIDYGKIPQPWTIILGIKLEL
jgi:TonB-linked SusC/RagA family outer membrane protein